MDDPPKPESDASVETLVAQIREMQGLMSDLEERIAQVEAQLDALASAGDEEEEED
jgi:hypothetical protein